MPRWTLRSWTARDKLRAPEINRHAAHLSLLRRVRFKRRGSGRVDGNAVHCRRALKLSLMNSVAVIAQLFCYKALLVIGSLAAALIDSIRQLTRFVRTARPQS